VEIRATVHSSASEHRTAVSTDGSASAIAIAGRQGGGSAQNGGELLCLALATCYCNDLYREAARRGLTLDAVEVEAVAEFGGVGEPARRITYSARVESASPADAIEELLAHTDRVAEVHNTLRVGTAVTRV
jgi:organic hydroperoxide reductase OsmC/OhrA